MRARLSVGFAPAAAVFVAAVFMALGSMGCSDLTNTSEFRIAKDPPKPPPAPVVPVAAAAARAGQPGAAQRPARAPGTG